MRLVDCFSEILAYALYLTRRPEAGVDAAEARETIDGLLDRAAETGRKAGVPPADVEEASFAVCAFVDETILCSTWSGAQAWKLGQLQQARFGTANAGLEFFDRLEALPPEAAGVREVYALCLEFGFRGKYFFAHQEADLAAVRQKVLRQVLGRDLSEFSLTETPLFPGASSGPGKVRKASDGPWKFDWALVLVPLFAALASVEIYYLLDNDLNLQLLGFFGSIG